MEQDLAVNNSVVTKFVREVIGCNCPDEVFRHVQIRRSSSAIESCKADYELRIGGRLLIVVISEPVEALSVSRLQQVILEGKRIRDEGEFNRFRLVVRTPNAVEDKERLLRAFEAVSVGDDRTHIHVLERREVPNF
jgi:hypothetical protein